MKHIIAIIALFFFASFTANSYEAEKALPNSKSDNYTSKSATIEKVFTNDSREPVILKPSGNKPIGDLSKNKPGKKPFIKSENPPIFYKKDNIIIHRKLLPVTNETEFPWQKQEVQSDSVVIDTEIRDSSVIYNPKGWFNLSSYSEKNGVMIVFPEPDTAPIMNSAQYAPVDILLIDKQGKIKQIVPNILLSELEQDIIPSSPVLAFLFLKGGACGELSINVGDELEYSIFKKPPVVLSAPPQLQAPRPQTQVLQPQK